jgi:hypothetical protein
MPTMIKKIKTLDLNRNVSKVHPLLDESNLPLQENIEKAPVTEGEGNIYSIQSDEEQMIMDWM